MEVIIVFIFYAIGQVTPFSFQDFDDNYVLGVPYVTFSTQFVGNDGVRSAHNSRNKSLLFRKGMDPSNMATYHLKTPHAANKEELQNWVIRPYRKIDSIDSILRSLRESFNRNPDSEYSSQRISSKPIVKREVISRNRFFYNKDEFGKFFDSFLSFLSNLNPELLNSLREHLDNRFSTERNSVLIERKMGTLLAMKTESRSYQYKENTKSDNRESSTPALIESHSNGENSSNSQSKTTDSSILKQNLLARFGASSITENFLVQNPSTRDLSANAFSKIEKDPPKSEILKPWYTFRPFFGLGRIQGDIGSHFNKAFWSTETASTLGKTEIKNFNVVADEKSHTLSTEPSIGNSTFNNTLYKLSKDFLQKILPNLGGEDNLDAKDKDKDSNKLVDQLLDKLFSIAIESVTSSSTTAKDEFEDYQIDMTMPSNRKLLYGPESYFRTLPTLIQRPLKGVKKLHNRGGILSGFILESAKNRSDSPQVEHEERLLSTTSQYEEDDELLRNEYDNNYYLDDDQSEDEIKAHIAIPKNHVKTKVFILNPFNENKSDRTLNDLKRLEEAKRADLNEKLKMNSNLLHQSIERIPLHIAFMKNIHYSSKRPKRNKHVLPFKKRRKIDKLYYK